MQLTRAADYAVRVMVHMATLPPRERALLPALARATATPESFLSKVLQALTRAHLITSRRGQSGGFEILPRGRQATIRDVIHLNVCLVSARSCGRATWCPAHPVWERAQQAMLAVLSESTVTQLAAQPIASQPPSDSVLPIASLSSARA